MRVATVLLLLLALVPAARGNAYVPVYVMGRLSTVTNKGALFDKSTLETDLNAIKTSGADGIMLDHWWGVVERSGPKTYDWSAYLTIADLVQKAGLKMIATMSFHKCGGNVGDDCDIPLPSWVTDVGLNNPDIWYKDDQGHYDDEYLSLWVDNESLFGSPARTPVKMYSDFVQSYVNTFSSYLGTTIVELQISLGPAGEMRYPSYQNKYWSFNSCGVGAFQSYNSYALASVQAAAKKAGQPNWGLAGGPANAGSYDTPVSQSGFFSSGSDNYQSAYGEFFLSWYSQELIDHGSRVLSSVVPIVQNAASDVAVAAKVAGIHWLYKTASHAAECTAGYYNTNNNDAYADIAAMFATTGVDFDFTCLEMTDSSQPVCDCAPQQLVAQAKQDAINAGVTFSGENALPVYGDPGYNEIETNAGLFSVALGKFSYLRASQDWLNAQSGFTTFVSNMHNLLGNYLVSTATHELQNADGASSFPLWAAAVVGAGAAAAAVVVVGSLLAVRRRLAPSSSHRRMEAIATECA